MIKLHHGDCLEVMKDIPDGSIDMVMTSPPYDNLRSYNGNIEQWNFEKFKSIANELFRIVKKGGVIVWIVADQTKNYTESGTSFKQAIYFKEIGFKIYDTMIWQKPTASAIGSLRRYENIFEYMFVFSKGRPKTVNIIRDKPNKCRGEKVGGAVRGFDGTFRKTSNSKRRVADFGRRSNIWKISTVANYRESTGHPAQYPVQLATDHIISWSNKDDTILDIFMGSGSTGIACLNTGRRFVGIELDKQYFEIAKKRITEKGCASRC